MFLCACVSASRRVKRDLGLSIEVYRWETAIHTQGHTRPQNAAMILPHEIWGHLYSYDREQWCCPTQLLHPLCLGMDNCACQNCYSNSELYSVLRVCSHAQCSVVLVAICTVMIAAKVGSILPGSAGSRILAVLGGKPGPVVEGSPLEASHHVEL